MVRKGLFSSVGYSGSLISGYADTSQVGITIPGNEQTFNNNVSPLLGNYTLASLGEIPQNTNLIINYRVGGGINSNVPSGDLTSLQFKSNTAIEGVITSVKLDSGTVIAYLL